MILHSDREGNDCIRKLRCHCIQIMHSDIYSGLMYNDFGCSKHRLAEQSNWVTHKQHNIISSKPWPSYQCNQRVLSYTRGWLRVWKMSTLTGGYIMLLKVTFANSAGVLLENVLNLVGFSFGSTITIPVQTWYCKTNGLLLQSRLFLPEDSLRRTMKIASILSDQNL